MIMKNLFHFIVGIAIVGFVSSSCTRETSTSTGWSYNDPKNGGFEKSPSYGSRNRSWTCIH